VRRTRDRTATEIGEMLGLRARADGKHVDNVFEVLCVRRCYES
jgi:hypothetical protein